MKNYLEERIDEVRNEKEMWLDKLEHNEQDEYLKTEYLISYSVLSTLLEIQERLQNEEARWNWTIKKEKYNII